MAALVRPPGRPLIEAGRLPDDYVADDVEGGSDAQRRSCRGTVAYDPGWRNYARHAVEIPGGTTINGANFAHARLSIVSPGSVTLSHCNLTGARWRAAQADRFVVVKCNTTRSAAD